MDDQNEYFEGIAWPFRCEIEFAGRPIDLFLDEINHSSTGFQWGYCGSGPAQSAYAILRTALSHVFHDQRKAIFWAKGLYQEFKFDVIAKLPRDKGWILTLSRINTWVFAHKERVQKEWDTYHGTD